MCEYLLSLFPSAPIGIFQIQPLSNSLRLDEGQSVQTVLIFLSYGQAEKVMPNLYKVSANGDLIHISASSNSGVFVSGIVNIGDYCAPGLLSTPRPNVFGVRIINPSLADSGTYTVIDTIDGSNYTANFTISGKK